MMIDNIILGPELLGIDMNGLGGDKSTNGNIFNGYTDTIRRKIKIFKLC